MSGLSELLDSIVILSQIPFGHLIITIENVNRVMSECKTCHFSLSVQMKSIVVVDNRGQSKQLSIFDLNDISIQFLGKM